MATSQNAVGYVPADDEIRAALDKTKWGKTYLTEFLLSADINTRITYLKRNGYFEMLENLGDIFISASENVGYSDNSSFVIALLLGRACGNYFATVRLSSSGQLSEAYVQLRTCIESALYAFNIHSERSSAQVWLDRHKSNKSRKVSLNLFKPGVIMSRLEQTNQSLGQETKRDYEHCIDYGAHPNERSVSSNLNISGGKISLILLNTTEGIFEFCLSACVMCGLDVVKIFNLIYPDDFKKFNADQRMQSIQLQFGRIAPGVSFALRAYPNNPEQRNVITAQTR
ncbi:MAG: hypothetical protein ABII09_02080 [Planctomycetota bacterium]